MNYKIVSIRIEGMHNVVDKTYELRGGLSYFYGKNGAGKSTILQAIQLALLGYIPGYGKKNDEVFKHARSKLMSVTLTLVDENEKTHKITRTWTLMGQSVKYGEEIDPELGDPKDLVGEIELPIFNFTDFTNLSANKLKEWFITFLPNAESEIDWEAKLTESLGDMELADKDLVAKTVALIKKVDDQSGATGVELIKEINEKLKETQQFTRGEIDSLNKTVQSLTYYEDIIADDEEPIKAEIKELSELKDKIILYNSAIAQRDSIQGQLANIEVAASSFDADPRVPALQKQLTDAEVIISELTPEFAEAQKRAHELRAAISSASTLADASGLCPYTKEACETAKSMIKDAKKAKEEATAAWNEAAEAAKTLEESIHKATETKLEVADQLSRIKQNYNKVEMLRSMLKDLPEDPGFSIMEVSEKITALNDTLNKVRINNQYKATIDKMTADKFVLESNLEAYKIWVKLTGANGLQTEFMSGPFEQLAKDMNKYLTAMFGKETECRFNLSEKANSFSFGLIRDDKYITFETLSAGERCLYTIALMTCILDSSNSKVKVLIIDDLVDHLDDDNAESTFKSLLNMREKVQLILAGVKPCEDFTIRVDI